MSSIAIEVRPAFIGSLLLTVGLAVGLQCAPRPGCVERAAAVIRMQKPVIVAMELAPPHARGPVQPGDVLTPPAHPDARPWPHGMIITPPPTPDDIQARLPGALDRLLSAVLAALLPHGSLTSPS